MNTIGDLAQVRALVRALPSRMAAAPLHQRLQAVSLLLAGLLLFLLLVLPYNRNSLVVVLDSPSPGRLQVYFDMGGGLSEPLSVVHKYPAGHSELRYAIPIGTLHALRLDPDAGAAPLSIEQVALVGFGGRNNSPLADPTSLQGFEMQREAPDPQGHARFSVAPNAVDPQLPIPLATPLASNSGVPPLLWKVLWWSFGLSLLAAVSLQFVKRPMPTIALSVIVLGLCAAMAMFSVTDHSVHPDELLHDSDASYFRNHWTPPRIDTPDLAGSFTSSPYGVTYLSEWNVVYLFASKASRLFRELGLSPMLAYRAFHIALFSLMLVTLAAIRAPRGAYIPLLVTPQLWYVFSYFNGDAFPFAMGMVAAVVGLMPKGPLQNYLQHRKKIDWMAIAHIALFSICLGLLILSKKNYWPVAVFIIVSVTVTALRLRALLAFALVTLLALGIVANSLGADVARTIGSRWLVVSGILATGALGYCVYAAAFLVRDRSTWPGLIRLFAVFSLCVLVAAPWIAVDRYKHRGEPGKTALIEQLRERYAAPQFKPSVIPTLPLSTSSFNMEKKGVPLLDLFDEPKEWHVGTFRSFFGVYGYMEYFDTEWGYRVTGFSVLGMLLLAVGWGLGTRTLAPAQLVLSVGCAGSLILASLMHSWTYDFQPQGRYVLGIIVMMVPLFMQTGETTRGRVIFSAVALLAFALSAMSYMWIALPNLI